MYQVTFWSTALCCSVGQGLCLALAELLPSVTHRQPLEPPSTPGCNPGKLRLIEDAEDWQPRTGTSQSRTFRKLAQLTGTDSSSEFLQGLALAGGAGLSLGYQGPAESGVALECWFWPRVVPVGWPSQWELPGAVRGLVVVPPVWGLALPCGRVGLCFGARVGGRRGWFSSFPFSLLLCLGLGL